MCLVWLCERREKREREKRYSSVACLYAFQLSIMLASRLESLTAPNAAGDGGGKKKVLGGGAQFLHSSKN